LAEKQHKTVEELLTGKAAPISAYEFDLWPPYESVKAKLHEEARKKAEKSAKNG